MNFRKSCNLWCGAVFLGQLNQNIMNCTKLDVALTAAALLGICLNLVGIPLGFFAPLAFSTAIVSLALLAAVRDYGQEPRRFEPTPAPVRSRPASARYPLAA